VIVRNLKNFLFTFLIPLFYLAGPIIIYLNQSQFLPGLGLQLLGLLLAFSGLLFWFGGYFSLGLANFSVLPSPRSFQKKGLYRLVSHPIYLGISLTFLGLSLTTGSKTGLIYALLLVLPLNLARAKIEEKKLHQKFGKAYQEYQKKTLI
jgi:protein-S-isoprenylcysteine O-methyltransferase Ste14